MKYISTFELHFSASIQVLIVVGIVLDHYSSLVGTLYIAIGFLVCLACAANHNCYYIVMILLYLL